MTNGIPIGTKKGIVYQVTESNPDKYRAVEDENSFTELKGSVTLSNIKGKTVYDECFLFGDCAAWVKDIVPIPLTPEILEKNGWKLHKHHERNSYDDVSWSSYHKPAETNISLRFYQEEKAFFLFLYEQEISETPIRYIHQLQHLLYGLGINREMDV